MDHKSRGDDKLHENARLKVSVYIRKNNDNRIKSRWWHFDIVFMVISPDGINAFVVCDISNPSSYNLSSTFIIFILINCLSDNIS